MNGKRTIGSYVPKVLGVSAAVLSGRADAKRLESAATSRNLNTGGEFRTANKVVGGMHFPRLEAPWHQTGATI